MESEVYSFIEIVLTKSKGLEKFFLFQAVFIIISFNKIKRNEMKGLRIYYLTGELSLKPCSLELDGTVTDDGEVRYKPSELWKPTPHQRTPDMAI